jgi:hypothetical protein
MHTHSRCLAMIAALSLAIASCADPATLPGVTVEVSGISETIRGREAGLGDVGIELLFTPSGLSVGAPQQRRIALHHGTDSEKFTVQIPDGQYRMAVNIYTVVDCSGTARQQILGTQATVLMVATPQTAGTWIQSPVVRGEGLSPCR